MREDLRKKIYGYLYHGTKIVCLLTGCLAGLLSLCALVMIGLAWLAPPSLGMETLSKKLFFSAMVIPGIALNVLIVWKAFPLLRGFMGIGPDKTNRMALVLGLLAWSLSARASLPLEKKWIHPILENTPPFVSPEGLFIVVPILIGCVIYGITKRSLSIIGQRLEACDPKPEDPASPGETPQEEGEAM